MPLMRLPFACGQPRVSPPVARLSSRNPIPKVPTVGRSPVTATTSTLRSNNLVEERQSVVAHPLPAKVHQVSFSEHRPDTSVALSPCLVPGLLAKPKALITPSAFISKIPVLMKSSALSKRVPSPSLPENDAQELALDASLRVSARQSAMNAMRRNGGKTFGITAKDGGQWLKKISTARLQSMVPDHSAIAPRSKDQTYYAADGQLVRRRSVRWPADGHVVVKLRKFKDCKDSSPKWFYPQPSGRLRRYVWDHPVPLYGFGFVGTGLKRHP